jgi:hypothetical protein
MRKRILLSGVALCVILVTGTALAANRDVGVPRSSMNGVKHAMKKDGSLRVHSVGHLQLKNQVIDCEKLVVDLQRKLCGGLVGAPGMNGAAGVNGANGAGGAKGDVGKQGGPGVQGATGPQGNRGDGTIVVNETTPGVCLTNPSVHLTSTGVTFGPYTSNEEGGSLCVNPGEGVHLRDVAHLAYTASFSAGTDNGDAPYLRVFLNGDADDVIFSPSTQPGACYGPAPILGAGSQCASRGRMIEYHVDHGTVRYDDDPGSAPDVSWAEVLNAHGADTITAIYVTSGFALPDTTGAVLNSISFEIAGQLPTTLAFSS